MREQQQTNQAQQANVHKQQQQHTQMHSTMEIQSEKDDRIQWYHHSHLLSHALSKSPWKKLRSARFLENSGSDFSSKPRSPAVDVVEASCNPMFPLLSPAEAGFTC